MQPLQEGELTTYIETEEKPMGQKDMSSLAPDCLYSAEVALPEILFGSVKNAQEFAERFVGVSRA